MVIATAGQFADCPALNETPAEVDAEVSYTWGMSACREQFLTIAAAFTLEISTTYDDI